MSAAAPYRRETVSCLSAAGFHRMAYRDWGPPAARGVVVCVHGLTRNGSDFDPLAAALAAEGWRVVCPDVVGRGASDWLADANAYGYPQYLADMLLGHLRQTLARQRAESHQRGPEKLILFL